MAVLTSLHLISSYCYHKNTLYVGLKFCHLMSDKYFSRMYILFRIIAQFYSAPSVLCMLAAALVHSRKPRPLLTEKWIYLHDFLTFTDEKYTCDVSVMH